ncbi:hypothetical protein IHQ71_11090 [Rhizobium sp. TH2]|uniref:hypothetical protein n=1 Tax=Rhizobium sp. TH2 TaxID=2775403 RepID=UPI0021578209|nr:hypothetical protein [Rhizobium sp. TH2]UVC11071.1 hypothetical protein IHQ71_11090 [Rhizobium sp. TH2]
MRFILKLFKWLVVLVILLVIGLASPIAYVELACHAPVTNDPYKRLITDAAFQRKEANSYLTYPEWHIVYAYDGLAEALKSGDEHEFSYIPSVWNFWKSTCALTGIADRHGGADSQTRTMIYTIGASFTLEMGLKGAYEETIGRIFAAVRGPVKTPQDEVAAIMAVAYAAFLRQTPWYKYDFEKQVATLWAAPMIEPARGWERRLALGGEWKAKTFYAGAIAAGVAATGEAKLEIRSVVSGLSADQLRQIPDVKVISDVADGVVIETPRYDSFTKILIAIAKAGGQIREIAGNDDIMVGAMVEPEKEYAGPGEVIVRIGRESFATERVLVNMKVTDLAGLLASQPLADPSVEHVFDY